MSMLAQTRRSFSFQGRSFLAFVLAPSAPLHDWVQELEAWTAKSPDFFSKKPVILDLSGISLNKADFTEFLMLLRTRKFRLLSIEGVDPDWLEPELEPLADSKHNKDFQIAQSELVKSSLSVLQNTPDIKTLILNNPVRSGQSIHFPSGDVTIIGSVASGAEIISGGSIHIYGTLRGRAFAGSAGNEKARIFCNRFEAELLVIGGIYKSPENIDKDFYGKPVQAWLEGKMIKLKQME
ncbi:MAG: septum site-determining protein MinC [Devosiaceae bacterium]|nr:septum site-determining protein MinC [Devosiaceae bacterium]